MEKAKEIQVAKKEVEPSELTSLEKELEGVMQLIHEARGIQERIMTNHLRLGWDEEKELCKGDKVEQSRIGDIRSNVAEMKEELISFTNKLLKIEDSIRC